MAKENTTTTTKEQNPFESMAYMSLWSASLNDIIKAAQAANVELPMNNLEMMKYTIISSLSKADAEKISEFLPYVAQGIPLQIIKMVTGTGNFADAMRFDPAVYQKAMMIKTQNEFMKKMMSGEGIGAGGFNPMMMGMFGGGAGAGGFNPMMMMGGGFNPMMMGGMFGGSSQGNSGGQNL